MFQHKKVVLTIAAALLLIIIGALIGSYLPNKDYFQATGAPEYAAYSTDGEQSVRQNLAPDMKAESDLSDPAAPTNDRLIVKTGNLSLVVKDVAQSIGDISNYAKSKNGFVVSSSVNKYDDGLTGNITIRVPAEGFDQSLSDLKAMGEVTSENSYGDDITEQYIDLEARLKNLKATEEQYLAILKQATKIEDVLAVQRELSYTRSEIESIETQIKYLSQSAELSTITIYLSTDPSTLPILDDEESWKPWAVAKGAARSLVELGQLAVNGLIWLAVYIPVLAVLGLIIWGIVRLVHRWRR